MPIRRAGRSILDFHRPEEIVRALSDEDSRKGQSASDWKLVNSNTDYVKQDVSVEATRLGVLKSYQILDTEMEDSMEELTAEAGVAYGVPWACVSFVDMGRQWYKSMYKDDLGIMQVARQDSFCTHTIQMGGEIMIVPDTLEDPRFCDNPYVTGYPSWRFYAGVPLVAPEGVRLGTFCLLDRRPRPDGLTEKEQQNLKRLAKSAMERLVARKEKLMVKETVGLRKRPSTGTLMGGKEQDPKMVAKDSKKVRTESSEEPKSEATENDAIPRPASNVVLPSPHTNGVDPDTYLAQLLDALYGIKLELKTAHELGDFFPAISEKQISAYNLKVVAVTRGNKVEELRAIYDKEGRDALDCFNRFGEGLLNIACRRGFRDIVKLLLSDEVNLAVRIRDDYGRTPMHDACWNPSPLIDICTWLMEKDPSLFLISDKRGYTPFQYARKSDWPVWRKFLFDNHHLLSPLASASMRTHFS